MKQKRTNIKQKEQISNGTKRPTEKNKYQKKEKKTNIKNEYQTKEKYQWKKRICMYKTKNANMYKKKENRPIARSNIKRKKDQQKERISNDQNIFCSKKYKTLVRTSKERLTEQIPN